MRLLLKVGNSGLLLASALFVGGCTETSVSSPVTNDLQSSNTPPAFEIENSAELSMAETNEITEITRVEPAPGAGSEVTLPPHIKPTRNLTELLKLVQAGVDESVILHYVTNSSGTFNLDSDVIVYLTDLGVSGGIITAMMEHDRALGAALAQMGSVPTTNPTVPAVTTDAYAPSALPAEETVVTTPVEYAQPEQPVSVEYFYNSLSPYGSWVYVSGYGRCWQPSVVVIQPTWQPYSDRGRWVYTRAGWYWVSDYSWGATTFHYGRWFRHARYGWCWYPETTWSPAWVTWRYSTSYCGWAPLPPHSDFHRGRFSVAAECYTFVPVNRFCDRRPTHHALPRHQSRRAFRDTRPSDHFVQTREGVANTGIPSQQIAVANNVPLRPVAIRDESSRGGRSRGDREQLERRGNDVVVARPTPDGSRTAWQPNVGGTRRSFGDRDSRFTGTTFPSQRNNTPVTAPPLPGSTPATAPPPAQPLLPRDVGSATRDRSPGMPPRTDRGQQMDIPPSSNRRFPRNEDGMIQRGENRFVPRQNLPSTAVQPRTPAPPRTVTPPSRSPVIIRGNGGSRPIVEGNAWQNRFNPGTPVSPASPVIQRPAAPVVAPNLPVNVPRVREPRMGNDQRERAAIPNYSTRVEPNVSASRPSPNPAVRNVIQSRSPAVSNAQAQEAPPRGNNRGRGRER